MIKTLKRPRFSAATRTRDPWARVCGYEDRYFFELDLGTEHAGTLAGKAKRYLDYYRSGEEQRRHEVFPRTVWTVPDRGRVEEVAEALRRLPDESEPLFAVWPFDEVIGRLAAEAKS